MSSLRIHFFPYFFIGIQFMTCPVQAQNDKAEIQRLREASNEAIKYFDDELSLSFMTDDVLTTTGNGTLIHGKENLKEYILKTSGPKMFWIRTPNEIELNVERGLAWETGTWKGYTTDSDQKAIVGGKYSAMWAKINGGWKIKSQLFVTLE